MHAKMKGALGEMTIAADLIRQGYFVFTELGDLSKTDLIAVDAEHNLYKIQVKALTTVSGKVELSAKKSGPNYSFRYHRSQVDVFAILVLDKNIVLYVNADELLQKTSLSIRIDKTKNSQKKRINDYHKYLDFVGALRDYTQDFPTDKAVEEEIVQTTTNNNSASEN